MSDNRQEGPDLSVVIIAKNEEEMIGDCVESVLVALKHAVENKTIGSYEVILADSASTDRTIEIAKKYPIKIVQLKKNWTLSASAGRYIGYLHTKGNYVFFTDGDSVLNKEWFTVALPYLKDENVAAVDGIEREYIRPDDLFSKFITAAEQEEIRVVTEVEIVGQAIFKRDVLREVGSYNPYLKGGEDRDISYRITDAGYKLLRLPFLCVTHYWAKKKGKLTLRRYLKSVYVWSKGDGQALRYHSKNKDMAIKHITRYINTSIIRIYGLIFLSCSLIYMNILTIMIIPQALTFLGFTLLMDVILLGLGATYAYIRYKGGKWKDFIFSFHVILYVFIRHIGFIIGCLKKPKHLSTYPTDVKIIKE